MATQRNPNYEYEVAEVGDAAPPLDYPVVDEKIEQYLRSTGDNNPLYTDSVRARALGLEGIVPTSATKVMPRLRRTTMMRMKGYEPPIRPTGFARWQHRMFAPIKRGDVITGVTRLADKFEKRGRQFLVFQVTGYNQHGEKVVEYFHTSFWRGAKPEDKTR